MAGDEKEGLVQDSAGLCGASPQPCCPLRWAVRSGTSWTTHECLITQVQGLLMLAQWEPATF